ncbi:MAG: hypothetical protein ACRCYY_17185 [Trueperaceae bacterium]
MSSTIIDMEDWQLREMKVLQKKYGEVAPPWTIFPDEHPYSLCWRMGTGEGHVMVWSAWWQTQRWNEEERIDGHHCHDGLCG